MPFTREQMRTFPDGSVRQIKPFHLSLEGMRTSLLCKDDEDYGVFVKYIFICALRANLIISSYAVVSNHAHILALSDSKDKVYGFGEELKRVYGMYFVERHNEESPMFGNKILPLEIQSDSHLRNTMAYIPRNALDNGENIDEYRWSSYSVYFHRQVIPEGRKVKGMTTREAKRIFKTNLILKDVSWLVDGDEQLIPSSACDHRYVEDAFFHDQAYFIRLIGSVNVSEMDESLNRAPRTMLHDKEYLREAENICQKWYQSRLSEISIDKKIRLIVYMSRIRRSTIPQMSRIFGMERNRISEILDHGTAKRSRYRNSKARQAAAAAAEKKKAD